MGHLERAQCAFGNALAGGSITAALADVGGTVVPPSLVTPTRIAVIVGALAAVSIVM